MVRQETLLYPLPDQEIDLSIIDSLKFLVIKQRQELKEGEFIPKPVTSRKDVLQWLEESENFQEMYREAILFHLLPRTDYEIEEYRSRFSGKIYQNLASCFLAGKQTGSRILLSLQRTFEFYKSLHPEAEEIDNPLGFNSLERISVPDGIIVERAENNRILTICEYTLTGINSYFEKKYRGFNIDKRKFPQLFADTQLLFVTPELTHIPTAITKRDGAVLFLPFKHNQFRNFVNKIYSHYRQYRSSCLNPDNVSATLVEMQTLVRERHL